MAPGAEVEATYNGGKTWRSGGCRGRHSVEQRVLPQRSGVRFVGESAMNNQPLFVETTDGGTSWVSAPGTELAFHLGAGRHVGARTPRG